MLRNGRGYYLQAEEMGLGRIYQSEFESSWPCRNTRLFIYTMTEIEEGLIYSFFTFALFLPE